MIKIDKIVKLIEKFGDGDYRIKIKNSKVVIFSKNNRYEHNELKKILEDVKKDEP